MLEILRGQYARGYASELDVAAQEAQLAQVTATLPPLLKQLTGVEDFTDGQRHAPDVASQGETRQLDRDEFIRGRDLGTERRLLGLQGLPIV